MESKEIPETSPVLTQGYWKRRYHRYPVYHRDGHYVFVYGSLKKKRRLSKVMNRIRAKLVGEAMTAEPKYNLLALESGFPGATRGCYHIAGELYQVSGAALWDLDCVELEGELFDRKTINVMLTDEQAKLCPGSLNNFSAWAYFVRPRYRNIDPRSKAIVLNNGIKRWEP